MKREELKSIFDALRNDPAHHLGLGDIRLTIAQQDEILAMVSPLPPAEGAEQRIRVRNILQDFYRRGEYELEQAEEDIMRLFQPQPTAEGAEEILLKHGFFVMTHKEGSEHVRKVFIEPVIAAMQEFATLHARKMAEEMVEEKLTALISEGYVSKEEHDKLLQQRDELREALISMMWQFAYYGTKNNVAIMHTGRLSALEDAFSALGLSDPITVESFEAAIKNTER